jgi:hypothetical protein
LLYTGVTYLLYSGDILLYTGVTYLLYSGVIYYVWAYLYEMTSLFHVRCSIVIL